MESVHKGHRDRLKKRFAEYGLDNFSDIEAIEFLLFYALPRRDTNALSHALLDYFGSFRAVMEAGIDDLMQVAGIGENAAMLICLVSALNRRYFTSSRKPGAIIRNSKDAGEYLLPMFSYLTQERAYVLCLDSKSMVTYCRPLAEGIVNKVEFAARDIVDIALRYKAAAIILAHNHPSDIALPSNMDISSTKSIYSTLRSVGVQLFDHIIVSGDDFVSLKDSGVFDTF